MARTDPRPHYGTYRRVDANGYVSVWKPGHPLARAEGYVYEHRLVLWDAGFDPRGRNVHHRNGDRTDNRLENLEILGADVHAAHHAHERGTITNQFGTWPLRPPSPYAELDRANRCCVGCGELIPEQRRADARYCSKECANRSWKRARSSWPNC